MPRSRTILPSRPYPGIACVLALFLIACGRESAEEVTPRHYLVTLVPRAERASPPVLPLPHLRYPVGSRLVRLDLPDAHGHARFQLLSEGLVAAGGAIPTLDREGIVFLGKASVEEPYAIYTCRRDGSERRRLVVHDGDCGALGILPDGRLVYAGETNEGAVLRGARSGWALFLHPGAGASSASPGRSSVPSAGRRITFSAGFDVDPWVLSDGRILYASWQPGAWGEDGGLSLFTVHPDGTGAAKLPGDHGGDPHARRPRQLPSGDIAYLRPDGDPVTNDLLRADWRSTGAGARRLPTSGTVRAAEPMNDGSLLLTVASEDPPGRVGLALLRPDGGEDMVLGTLPFPPELTPVEAVPVDRRRRPQGHLSTLDPSMSRGQLICIDARLDAPVGGTRVRLTALAGSHAGGLRPGGRVLGEIALEEDGSFFADVPADTPLILDLLDADGRVLVAGLTPFWVRPNEARACIGCHEDPETAPPNRRPQAVLEDAVELGIDGGREP